jgi:hypothetical protein
LQLLLLPSAGAVANDFLFGGSLRMQSPGVHQCSCLLCRSATYCLLAKRVPASSNRNGNLGLLWSFGESRYYLPWQGESERLTLEHSKPETNFPGCLISGSFFYVVRNAGLAMIVGPTRNSP